MEGKQNLDDHTHRITLEDIVDPQRRRIMVFVNERIFEAEKVHIQLGPAKGGLDVQPSRKRRYMP
jgi:hypothetical protein